MNISCGCVERVAERPEPDWLREALLRAVRGGDGGLAWRALDLLGGLMGEW